VVGQGGSGSGWERHRLPDHGLDRPVLVDLKQNLHRVLGPHGDAVWNRTLELTRLTGAETDLASLELALSALGTVGHPVATVVARAMRVRVESYRWLSAGHATAAVGSAEAFRSPDTATPGRPTADTSSMAVQIPSGGREPGTTPNHLDALISFERLSAVAQYDVVNPELAAQLDEIARRTMSVLHQPCAYVSIVLDSAQLIIGSSGVEGWIKNVGGSPVEWSFCGHTVAHARPYLVQDAFTDPVHSDSPLVRIDGTGSYAGVPLVTETGQVIGAHCVMSHEPQTFSAESVAVLESAAQEIMALLQQYRVEIPASTWDQAWSDSAWEPVEKD
jgi:putative methionine-R-sulfoxide reductase with GAF domain